MILVIDASNIVTGGGAHHLVEILQKADPPIYGFKKIILCAPKKTLDRVEKNLWLEKHAHRWLDSGYFLRWYWRKKILPTIVRSQHAFLFCPGANKPPFKWPYVTMCQNLLPLELPEIWRYGFSHVGLRLFLLRFAHIKAYSSAAGVIFLTHYCHEVLTERLGKKIGRFKIIPHGINHDLFNTGHHRKKQISKPFKLLYISIVDVYKNQDKVAEAVLKLNRMGNEVMLTLVGPTYKPSLKKLNSILSGDKEFGTMVRLKEAIPYREIAKEYELHDAFVFASSCETFGMILTEAMAMGMPIACSSMSSMPETLGDAGIYFNPLSVDSIAESILRLCKDGPLRETLSQKALQRARQFNWEKCSGETFSFLSKTARATGF